jgi:hypothetical protein
MGEWVAPSSGPRRPLALQPDGSLQIAARKLRCGDVRNVLDTRLLNLGISVPDAKLLVINPALVVRQPGMVGLFIYHLSAGITTWALASLVRIVGPSAAASARVGSIARVLRRSASLLATHRPAQRIPPGRDAAAILVAVLPRPRPNRMLDGKARLGGAKGAPARGNGGLRWGCDPPELRGSKSASAVADLERGTLLTIC